MILRLLEFLGRKRVVLDRGPSHPQFELAKPWMNRYYVLFRKRPKWFPFNILIHEMLADDHGVGVHNHTFPYVTIVLRDGYWETIESGRYWRAPGYIGFRSANNLHRVDIKPGTKPLTIFIAASRSFAFKSFIFISAISLHCATETDPFDSLPGVCEPLSILAAFFNR